MAKKSVKKPSRAARSADQGLIRRATKLQVMDSPGYLFRQLQIRGSACFAAAVGVDGPTPQQFIALLTLMQGGRMSLTELATRTRIDRSTLGEMVQRLFERDLLNRYAAETDRRSIEVEVNEGGIEFMLGALPLVEKAQEDMMAPLSEEYRPLFLKCMRVLAEAELPVVNQRLLNRMS